MSLGPEGGGVRITGLIEKVFTPQSGKCCFVTISFPGERARTKVELVAFGEQIGPTKALGVGETATITAGLGMKKLTNKNREDVQVDGRGVWTIQLVVRTVKTEPQAEKGPTAWEQEAPAAAKKPDTLPGDVIAGDDW